MSARLDPWRANRASGLRGLRGFVPRAGSGYTERRNYDFGPEDRSNVSGLSPLLRHRLVLEEEVLKAVLAEHPLAQSESFVQEVFWRGYYKGWLEHRPDVWRDYGEALRLGADRLRSDPSLASRYADAVAGRTGIACFDAWAHELQQIGYLHNHARMWFASLWIYTLELPWALGADFFLRHLLDADAASNTLSWRWVCGLHTAGKTYLARASNIERFTGGRFRPGDELAQEAPARQEEAPARDMNASAPVVPGAALLSGSKGSNLDRVGLIVTEEDGCTESIPWPASPVATLGLESASLRARVPELGPVSDRARAFSRGAILDALQRSRTVTDASVAAELGAEPTSIEEAAAMIGAWARRHRVDTLVTAYLPVGPTRDLFRGAAQRLGAEGLGWIEIRRRYDDIVWPHATKGFFALKKRIPEMLAALEIVPSEPRAESSGPAR